MHFATSVFGDDEVREVAMREFDDAVPSLLQSTCLADDPGCRPRGLFTDRSDWVGEVICRVDDIEM